jgi:uncharacterized protein
MKLMIYFGHPAQYLFLRATVKALLNKGHSIQILIKTKDVLEELLEQDGLQYKNILHNVRGNSTISIVTSLLRRLIVIFPLVIRYRPNLLITTDATFAIIGKMLNINRISITEDDYEIVRNMAMLTYPFTQTILCPNVCDVGKWDGKKIGYAGYMKLGYLHPSVFSKSNNQISQYELPDKYAIIRLAELSAFHDKGIEGMSNTLLDQIIDEFHSRSVTVYISSEGQIEAKYERYLLGIKSNHMQQILAAASFLVSDSQSMSVEASMLGVPSIRISSLVGRISVLEELEHRYGLTFGFLPNNSNAIASKLGELLSISNISEVFAARRSKMLKEKIDVTSFLIWFLDGYEQNLQILRITPEYQNQFLTSNPARLTD